MITDTDRVFLPIGLEIDGIRYREVVIDEMTGIDEENLTSKKVKNNGAKAITLLLRRCIQEIEGIVPRKSNPLDLIDEKYVRNMYIADRDFLVLCIRALSGNDTLLAESDCSSCGQENAHTLSLMDLDVYEWDEGTPAEIEVEMPRGFYSSHTKQYHKKIKWGFPNGVSQEKIATLPENQVGTSLILSGLKEVEGMETLPRADSVRRLSVRDRGAIADAIMDNAVGVDSQVTVTCEHCGEEYTVEVNTVGFSNSGQPQTPKPSKSGKNGRKLRKKR